MLVLSLGVFSHWFIDTLVHAGDMPVFHDSLKTGLGLWQFPLVAYLLELSVLLIAGYYLLISFKVIKRHVILIAIMCVGFSSMFFAPEAEVSAEVVSITSLTLYVIIAFLAYWSEREINH